MNQKDFDVVVNKMIAIIKTNLTAKGEEYSDEIDRLRNFKDAANLNGVTELQALWGFVTKHVIALKDFIIDDAIDKEIPMSQWDEKLMDIICYMILLKAILVERTDE